MYLSPTMLRDNVHVLLAGLREHTHSSAHAHTNGQMHLSPSDLDPVAWYSSDRFYKTHEVEGKIV